MLSFKSPSINDRILAMAMKQIEKMLKEMQEEGKDLSRLKFKKFQMFWSISSKTEFTVGFLIS